MNSTTTESDSSIVEQIDAVLPQTQCTLCGFDGCRPYAEALARGESDINRCPPGGEEGMRVLARLLDRPEKPIAPDCGEPVSRPQVALIDEDICIGCVRCIQACPVDAIVGAPKLMHTVIESECTGCGLCLPPCPVDCIDLVPNPDPTPLRERAGRFRRRFDVRNERLARETRERERRRAARRERSQAGDDRARKRDEIAAAVARSRAHRNREPT